MKRSILPKNEYTISQKYRFKGQSKSRKASQTGFFFTANKTQGQLGKQPNESFRKNQKKQTPILICCNRLKIILGLKTTQQVQILLTKRPSVQEVTSHFRYQMIFGRILLPIMSKPSALVAHTIILAFIIQPEEKSCQSTHFNSKSPHADDRHANTCRK